MKILIIAPRYHTNLYFRIKALQDVGHNVVLAVQYKGKSECYDIIDPYVLGFSKKYFIIKKIINKLFKKKSNYLCQIFAFSPKKQIKKIITDSNPDIIVFKIFPGLFMLQIFLIARTFKKNVYLFIQTNKYNTESIIESIALFCIKKIFKVKRIFSPLKAKSGKKNNTFTYLPFTIETKNFEKAYFNNNQINILTIGKFVKRKNHLLLLKAILNLKDKYKIKLTIIGEKVNDNILNQVLDFIKHNKLNKIVEVKHQIPYKKILKMYKKYDLFVLPSYREPASYSILEAMANKLPVICSDTCGTKCYISNGKNGYIFKSNDVESLTSKIEEIISNKNNLVKMGKNSFALVQKNHSTRSFVKNFNQNMNYDGN